MTGKIILVRCDGLHHIESTLPEVCTKKFNYVTSYGAGKWMDDWKSFINIVIPVGLYMQHSYQKETLHRVVELFISNGKIVYLESSNDAHYEWLKKAFETPYNLLLG